MPTSTTDHSTARSDGRLQGKRILITGASSGVGLAAVRLFADEGARLVLVARRDEELRETVRKAGIDATVLQADLGERDAAQQAVRDAVAVLGGLDVVVSNAAAAVFGHTLEVHPDDFDRTIAVTFTAAVDVIREALPHLRRTRGTIVATGSLMTRVPLPTWGSYTAAKHALRGFLNTLRIEEREQGSGVQIAMVHPGPIDTPLFAQASSATGMKPRIPPDAYKPEVIAHALVEVAIRPRPEVVLGGETRAIDLLFGSPARPVAEAVLLLVDRWYRSGDETAIQPGSLWQTGGRPPALRGGIPSRDSMFAPLQLGRHLLPDAATPVRLVTNLVKAGRRAVDLAGPLTSPVGEVLRPDDGLEHGGPVPNAEPETVHV